MKNLIPTLIADFYKVSHREQYPENTEKVYSTWTPRSNKHMPRIKKVVHVGVQGFLKELNEIFEENFFNKSKEDIVRDYERYIKFCLGVEKPYSLHIEELHDLGYLPLKFKSLKEGSLIPMRVPAMTVENTDSRFFWLTNYIETLASANLWKVTTTASIAYEYRRILNEYAIKTTGSTEGVEFQGHDFSMRGLSGYEDSARSGLGHLVSFVGTDTIPAIQYAENYYNANIEKELVGCSVNATEHSVMSSYGKFNELDTFKRLVTEVYPTGIVSIVSDTWNLWDVLGNILPKLKKDIENRNGGENSLDKVVIRPDSGDPVLILCGNKNGKTELERKGVVEALYDLFGGSVSEKGYKILNSCIGTIYGDAITLDRCEEICKRLEKKGFASTNVIFGIGSYTYQYLTRDTLGFAMKATYVEVNGEGRQIFKDPVTDDGIKKSAKGMVKVVKRNGNLICIDQTSKEYEDIKDDLLEVVYENGKLVKEASLSEIRNIINSSQKDH